MKTLAGHTNFVFCVNFSPNSNLLVSGGFDETVRVWDAAEGELQYFLSTHLITSTHRESTQGPSSSLWSSDCCQFQSRWDSYCLLRDGWSNVRNNANSPRSELNSCCRRIWDAESGQCLKTLVDDDNPIWYSWTFRTELTLKRKRLVLMLGFHQIRDLFLLRRKILQFDYGITTPHAASRHTLDIQIVPIALRRVSAR